MAAEPAKKEEKKEAKKDEKKEAKKEPRGFVASLILFFLTFVVLPCVFLAACITGAYLLFGGQINWHGI